jgi:putative FmdB family regulatory protein
MPTYEWHCHGCGADFEVVAPVANRNDPQQCKCGGIAVREIRTAPMGQPDIRPYIAVAGDRAGKPITSRREHREFLKRNGFREAGDQKVPDKPLPMRRVGNTKADRERRREDLRQQLRAKVPLDVLRKVR